MRELHTVNNRLLPTHRFGNPCSGFQKGLAFCGDITDMLPDSCHLSQSPVEVPKGDVRDKPRIALHMENHLARTDVEVEKRGRITCDV